MKVFTAKEARELTELGRMGELYTSISEAAEEGKFKVEISYVTEREFNQLIMDGYKIYIDYGTTELTRYDDETMRKTDFLIVDWEV